VSELDPHFSAAQDYTLRFGNQVLFIRKLHKKMITLYQEQAAIYTGNRTSWTSY
jgi:hypothetical protein